MAFKGLKTGEIITLIWVHIQFELLLPLAVFLCSISNLQYVSRDEVHVDLCSGSQHQQTSLSKQETRR